MIYPTLVSVINVTVCVRNNMAERRDDVLNEKPTLCELCEHIHIGSKWYQLGIMLKLDSKKLNDIQKLPEDSTHKTSKINSIFRKTL